ncbi:MULTISPECIES: TIGR00153 family protein [Thermococcus]|uniref:Phosphate transport regulator (Distant PhoU-like protein) n=1 Tax=Thermococcus nautili TaxID=195522 RepID=W8PNA2_9EURY|nr:MULTISPECIES: TIGR00153 family protein [Thermococcus]AHL23529.1 Phosphate transport regulator (distant PhoU-like protein) [Thermococcus nautili]NJE49724.1 TIGR00153 family protein [Thermococcus sp. 9N3]CAI1492779.1 Phosphate transport regulator (distant homolog of PhoU) [Thermococcus nautili]
MPLFGGKESNVFDAIDRHLNVVYETVKAFEKLIEAYLNGDFEGAKELEERVTLLESEADKLRRSIELMLYEGAFLPASRGDYVRLSELIDQVADAAESAAHTLILAKPKVPEELREEIMALVREAVKTYEKLMEAVKALNEDVDRALELAKETEDLEENADKVEYKLKAMVFESETITTYAKLIWNQAITKVGDIADRAEDASDQVMLMAIKRRG